MPAGSTTKPSAAEQSSTTRPKAEATTKAPLLDASGKASKQVTLDGSVFAAEVKPHLVHETVRAELNALRAGTRGAKSRGLVSGGRSKPWRQKGTGRARAGTTRAPHWTGGGVAFPPGMRSFEVKVNRKARRAALRGALAAHAQAGTLALVDGGAWSEPSTKTAAQMLAAWGQPTPLVLVASDEDVNLARSFRNLPRVAVIAPSELDVAAVVWARSLLVSQAALAGVLARAGAGDGNGAATEAAEEEPS
jgi:large subunit ribosomal protein L4